ncbi:DNA-binding response regulator [Candidatus Falkowbacteria bacterium HGW-Falkowbacteria-2]|uniref:DNA-binding response regulator n=1 Tax=Candidatus Falkowbacteria bacterium HGW-Falkowbacteria-2 TaxID=2013769 RepID=A0A2N2E397_9BACT|nr:MAG: DNA-binding response regulator [Candidatus Falkowbacteria bacterium HGW-Falkowbacteria-2]
MRILLVEDEPNLSRLITSLLTRAGFAVDAADDGERGSFLARTNNYDLVITDYIMPRLDGYNLIKEIRHDGIATPILMLSVRQSTEDKVSVLNIGADDYLPKPFAGEELVARVNALLRRPTNLRSGILTFQDLSLDPQLYRVKRGTKEIRLTNKEFSLLHYLLLNSGKMISRDNLLEHVWGGEIDPFSNTVETHILRLRRKLEGKGKKLIHNVAGRGYTLDLRP